MVSTSAPSTPPISAEKPVALPVAVSSTARPGRGRPPIVLKEPPTEINGPAGKIAWTGLSGSGAHDSSVPSAALKAARLWRGTPGPRLVKAPPTPSDPADTARAFALPVRSGFELVMAPLDGSTAAR